MVSVTVLTTGFKKGAEFTLSFFFLLCFLFVCFIPAPILFVFKSVRNQDSLFFGATECFLRSAALRLVCGVCVSMGD